MLSCCYRPKADILKNKMDIIKVSEILRSTSISVWAVLHLILGGFEKLIPPLVTIESSYYLYIILINIKFIAIFLFVFLLNWRGTYLIRLNGFNYHRTLELLAGIILSVFLIGLPFYIEKTFNSDQNEFVTAIAEAKISSLIILCGVVIAYILAFCLPKQRNTIQA